ncbi:MAG: biosynthetic-type acetolactate synthase large subunit [Oscillospiraceae bacterium]|nr:biosynthetic-type acetolactate synthase large subunit [Oscillospiraceae bacterium]
MKMTGAQIVIETLIEQGVTDVFGYPGGQVLNIYDAIYDAQGRINHILTAHEQGASHAADGYSRATGKVGVVIATSGPGATNLVTGIATAMLDSVPMVAITGNVPQSLIGRDSFQEIDITGITLPITKHNFFVHNVNQLADQIRLAFKIAKSGRPGTVLIDIPKDIQTAVADYEPQPIVEKFPNPAPNDEDIEAAIKLINTKSRPYIHIGGGVIGSKTYDLVRELAEKIDAVIGCSLMGLAAIPTDYERFLGMQGMHGHYASSVASNDADVIIAIGTRFSDRATGDKSRFAKGASIIHIDLDFAEINKNIPANVGVCGDISISLRKIIDGVEQRKNPDWMAHIKELKRLEKSYMPEDKGLTPHVVMETINDIKDADTIVATDVGQHQMWACQYINFQKPRKIVSSGGLGTMGFGMGAAIGACVGTGNKTVLITGDGSFGMNLNELCTAVNTHVPLTIVLMNNGTLGMVRQWQTLFYNHHYSNTTLNRQTDFVKLAEAFGAKGVMCDTPEKFRKEFRKAYDSDCVTLIDCRIDMDEFVLPILPPGGAIEDIIVEAKAKGE